MSSTSFSPLDVRSLIENALILEQKGEMVAAALEAWRGFDLDSEGSTQRQLVARLLPWCSLAVASSRKEQILRLLRDPDIAPSGVAHEAWKLLLSDGTLSSGCEILPLIQRLEVDEFAQCLLHLNYVSSLEAEMVLSRVRRELLLSRRWLEFPRLGAALVAQAEQNGGAWPFDAEERERLAAESDDAIVLAYLPKSRRISQASWFTDELTNKVAAQYERWPYPSWSRIGSVTPSTLADLVQELEASSPAALPLDGEVLVAGCGTGMEAAIQSARFPDAKLTAIDISESALAYARERCAGRKIDFQLLDIYNVAQLGRKFDVIFCSGVLHHLAEPERGWKSLVDVLKPDGIMYAMVYSHAARLPIRCARQLVADLVDRDIDDEVLRAVRRRLIARGSALVSGYLDFYTLSGVRDLLLHEHEDCFDVPRIATAMADLGLEIMRFTLPTNADTARYVRDNPHDPHFRDFASWSALEDREPYLFKSMYAFWCKKRVA